MQQMQLVTELAADQHMQCLNAEQQPHVPSGLGTCMLPGMPQLAKGLHKCMLFCIDESILMMLLCGAVVCCSEREKLALMLGLSFLIVFFFSK